MKFLTGFNKCGEKNCVYVTFTLAIAGLEVCTCTSLLFTKKKKRCNRSLID